MASFGHSFGLNSGDFGGSSGWQPVTIWVLLLLFAFGWLYSLLVYVYLPAWKIKHITAQEVIVGVGVTVAGYGFAIGWDQSILGWQAVSILLLCFVATGGPMAIGYWILDAHIEAKDRKKAQEIRRTLIEKLKKDDK